MLNQDVFHDIKTAKRTILVVTKYWDTNETLRILESCKENFSSEFYGLWENRIESIKEKNLPREHVHFIGNIQSRKIPDIVEYCSVIHSLENIFHAQKIEKQWFLMHAFIQIRLDTNKDIWISPEELPNFLEACKRFKYLKIIWISGMWAWEINEQEKKKEFQKLISLRNTHLPNGLISAGTSRDYEIALSEGIDIVRVGQKAIKIEL